MYPDEGEIRHLQNVAIYQSNWFFFFPQEDFNLHLVVYKKNCFPVRFEVLIAVMWGMMWC